jgi:hypothetical protein
MLVFVFFFSGFALALAVDEKNPHITVGDIVNPLATLVAAFAGSWAAFKLQQVQKEKENIKENVAAGNRALILICQLLNNLKIVQVDFIDPFRNSPARHLEIKPTLPYHEDSLTFDVRSLKFLINPKHQQVIMDLIIEESRYGEAIKTINVRSRHHLELIQPRLERAGVQEGREYSEDQFRVCYRRFRLSSSQKAY